jgi:hypothetical protein
MTATFLSYFNDKGCNEVQQARLPKFTHIRHSFGECVNNLSVTQDISKDAKLSPYGSVGNEFH